MLFCVNGIMLFIKLHTNHKKEKDKRIDIRRGLVSEEQFWDNMARMKAGDKEGLKAIYEAYMPYLYSFILQRIKNKEDAEDIVSELFLKLWRLAAGYEPKKGHKAWLTTIASNMAIDFLRKRKREELTDFSEKDTAYDSKNQYSQGLKQLNKEASKKRSTEEEVVGNTSFAEMLGLLKEKEQQIVYLKMAGELTFKEISYLLKEPIGTVTWRYNVAIKKLRRCGYYE